jgi:hypothetical protein
MIFWPFCAFIWFKNIEKMLLQMTSGFLQLESTLLNINANDLSVTVISNMKCHEKCVLFASQWFFDF